MVWDVQHFRPVGALPDGVAVILLQICSSYCIHEEPARMLLKTFARPPDRRSAYLHSKCVSDGRYRLRQKREGIPAAGAIC